MLYGLHIHSNEPLPLLPAPSQPPALTITFSPSVARPSLDDAKLHYAYPYINAHGDYVIQVYELVAAKAQVTDPSACLRYCYHTWFGEYWSDCILTQDGKTLLVFGDDNAPVAELIPYVLGGVVSSALRLQGVTCLHASAVIIDGEVVAFTGESTAGKSTTLAALLQLGAGFYSDDLVPLAVACAEDEPLRAYPGYPHLGLMDDAMRALFGPQADLPFISHTTKRVYTPTMAQDGTQPLPLRAVYSLSPRGSDPTLTQPVIVPLSQQDAVAALMPHTTGRTLRTPSGHVADLARIATLARTIPVARIDRPDDLRQLEQVAQAILHDVQTARAQRLMS